MEQTDKKISQMAPLQTVSGDEIVPVVKSGGNYSALVSQIVALARQTMVEAQAGKGLSANDFTDALKAKRRGAVELRRHGGKGADNGCQRTPRHDSRRRGVDGD